MKKTIIKMVVFLVVFFASILVISKVMNKGNTDMTTEMSKATLPLIYIEIGDEEVNPLRGYLTEMQGNYLRDSITPLGEDRSVNIRMETFGTDVSKLSFEVRSVDGSRLVESTEVTDYKQKEYGLDAKIVVKDLIEPETEYNLIFLLETGEGQTVRYYTRIILATEYFAAEKLEFVKYFNECTFDKEKAENISMYLETNSQGDNSTFGKVTINSNFNQITWGTLNVKKVFDPIMTIKEIANQTATIQMDYIVAADEGNRENRYRVKEFYRVRYTSNRIYLLNFERQMSQVFNENDSVYIGNKIMLGIQNKSVDMVESEGGNVFAFVAEDRLFSYNVADNKFAVLYGFYDENNFDLRTVYDANDIKILSVDETGNVRFMVYGYMNRGRHEGNVGIQVYTYNSMLNTIEEEVYIPYDKSYELLKLDVAQLSYVSKDNYFYLVMDCNVYAVNLYEQTYECIAEGIVEGNFEVSNDNSMMVIQTGEDGNQCERLILMNLNTRKQTEIVSGTGNYIKPIGFMGDDLIYGIAKQSDIIKDSSGLITFPMYIVRIQNELGEVLKEYQENDIYVTGGAIVDNQLVLNRVTKNVDQNAYTTIADDQILNNQVEVIGKNVVEEPVTESFLKIAQISVKSAIHAKTIKILTPKEVLFEGGREILLSRTAEAPERYYVYGIYGAQGVFTDSGNAVNLANSIAGVVLNDDGEYIWIRGNRSVRNQIMAITEAMVTEEKNSLVICMDTILKYEGVMRNTELLLKNGDTVLSILKENLETATILDLSGCSLDAILYYVNKDIPVLAMLNDGNAVLIVGFNETQVVIMDPVTGTLYKKSMTEATDYFTSNGNVFITYIK